MTSTSIEIARSATSDDSDYYLGVGLAVVSTWFIGLSFIIKKKALQNLQLRGSLSAGAGGLGYLKEWLWWAGLLSMGLGEAANFTAYAFAPASVVTPLGALSVLVSAVLASKWLKEHLNLLGKLGCLLCIVGSTVIVLHSPKEESVDNIFTLLNMLQAPLFVSYVALVIFVCICIYFYFAPKYGDRNVLVYLVLCSAVGSLSVMGCKGLALALRETFYGTENELGHWLTWICLIAVTIFVSIQLNYLNKALDLFSTGLVTPVYYVLFTTLVILASSILFEEWVNMSPADILGNICGFSTIVVGIIMLNAFKDVNVSLNYIQIDPRSRQKEDRFGINNDSEEDYLIGKSNVEKV